MLDDAHGLDLDPGHDLDLGLDLDLETLLASDDAFDRLYPEAVQRMSEIHWTPIDVATRAARMLVRNADSVILDVGSGAGKFCTVGALTTVGQFVGVEERPDLVAVARDLVAKLDVPRVQFLQEDALCLDWSQYDGIYLYNPFAERSPSLLPAAAAFHHAVQTTGVGLYLLRPGTRVVTYHGYGGPMPTGFERLSWERVGTGTLELWEKQTET